MNAHTKITLILAGAAIALPQAATAQSGVLAKAWAGTYHLNMEKSKFSSPEFTPKSDSRTYSLVGKRLSMRSILVNAQGNTIKWNYVASLDGKYYPTHGNPNTDHIALTYVGPREFKAKTTLNGKPSTRSTVTLSADGKELRIARSILTAKGGPTDDSMVFDRK